MHKLLYGHRSNQQQIAESMIAIAFLLLVALAHLPSLFAWFNGDDFIHIQELAISFPKLLTKTLSAHVFDPVQKDIHFRPLTNIFMGLLFDTASPIFIRSIILFLHFINGWLLFHLAQKIFNNSFGPFVSACLFLVNPSLCLTIYWISAIGDVLITFFGLLIMILFENQEKGYWSNILIIIYFILGLFSKEMIFTLPVLLLFYSFYFHRILKDWRLISILALVALIFFVFRGFYIGSFFAGKANFYYFSFGGNTLLAIVKYAVWIFSPFPFHWIVKQPVLLAFSLIWILGLFVTIRRENGIKNLKELSIFLIMIIISLLPVINSPGNWYLYFPMTFFALACASILSKIKIRPVLVVLIGFIFSCYIGVSNYHSINFSKSGEFQRSILKKLSQLPEKTIIIAGIPRSYGSGIPLLSFDFIAENALNRFYNIQKKIHYMFISNIENYNIKTYVWCKENQVEMQLPPKTYSYFWDIGDETSRNGWEIKPLVMNILGKPTSVRLQKKPGTPFYIYNGNTLERYPECCNIRR